MSPIPTDEAPTLHTTRQGEVLAANQRWVHDIGPRADLLEQGSLFDWVDPADQPTLHRAFGQLTGGRSVTVQVAWKSGDRLQLTLTPGAGIIQISATPLDTLAHQQVTRDARTHLYATLVDSSQDIIYVKDLSGVYTFINEAGARSLDRSPHQVIGRTDAELFGPEAGAEIRAIDAAVLRTGQPQTYRSDRQVQGQRRCFHTTKTPFRDANDQLIGLVGTSHDISALVRSQEAAAAAAAQLTAAERLVSVGSLAAGVAHEINNPLTWVLNHLEELEGRLADIDGGLAPGEGASLAARARAARQGAERIARVVRDLLVFTPTDGVEGAAAPLGPCLDKALQLAGPQLRHRARLGQAVDVSRPVRANPGRLSRALLGILQHLGQRLPAGAAWQHRIQVEAAEAGDEALITLTDDGPTPTEAELRHIFEPFAAVAGEARGMGLWVSLGLIQAMGGRVAARSGAPGLCIQVWLPFASPSKAPARVVEPLRRPPRVLVIDDEAEMRDFLEAGLHQTAGQVVSASSGRAGLALLREDADYDMVLCDLMMADLTGIELYEAVAAQWPHLLPRLVIMTGGAFSPESQRFLAEKRPQTLLKPFTLHALRALVTGAGAPGGA